MEEEWDLVNSLSSSLNIPERIEKSTSVELNFNRFANQPEFHIEDDGYPEDYDQQLMDEGVIFSDSPTPEDEIKDESMDLYDSYEEDINFTLGDSKLMDNDTVSDDVQRDNNELEQQRINQHKNIITSSFFPINNFMDKKDNSTRESEVDKQSLWEKNQAGPSVPYISSLKPFDNDEEEVNSEKMKVLKVFIRSSQLNALHSNSHNFFNRSQQKKKMMIKKKTTTVGHLRWKDNHLGIQLQLKQALQLHPPNPLQVKKK